MTCKLYKIGVKLEVGLIFRQRVYVKKLLMDHCICTNTVITVRSNCLLGIVQDLNLNTIWRIFYLLCSVKSKTNIFGITGWKAQKRTLECQKSINSKYLRSKKPRTYSECNVVSNTGNTISELEITSRQFRMKISSLQEEIKDRKFAFSAFDEKMYLKRPFGTVETNPFSILDSFQKKSISIYLSIVFASSSTTSNWQSVLEMSTILRNLKHDGCRKLRLVKMPIVSPSWN